MRSQIFNVVNRNFRISELALRIREGLRMDKVIKVTGGVFDLLIDKQGKVRRLAHRATQILRQEGVKVLAARGIRKLLTASAASRPNGQTATEPEQPVDVQFLCENPAFAACTSVYGRIAIAGWTVAMTGVKRVEVLLDGQCLGQADECCKLNQCRGQAAGTALTDEPWRATLRQTGPALGDAR